MARAAPRTSEMQQDRKSHHFKARGTLKVWFQRSWQSFNHVGHFDRCSAGLCMQCDWISQTSESCTEALKMQPTAPWWQDPTPEAGPGECRVLPLELFHPKNALLYLIRQNRSCYSHHSLSEAAFPKSSTDGLGSSLRDWPSQELS